MNVGYEVGGTYFQFLRHAQRASVEMFITACGELSLKDGLKFISDASSVAEEMVHVGWEIPGVDKGDVFQIERVVENYLSSL